METNRLLELLLAAAVRERANGFLIARMPKGLTDDAKDTWRDQHSMEALQDAHKELSDIAAWLQRQEQSASRPPAGDPPAAP